MVEELLPGRQAPPLPWSGWQLSPPGHAPEPAGSQEARQTASWVVVPTHTSPLAQAALPQGCPSWAVPLAEKQAPPLAVPEESVSCSQLCPCGHVFAPLYVQL